MFVIPEICKLNEFVHVECLSRREAFRRGLGVEYRYKSTPDFSNAIEQRKQSKVESFDMGKSIMTDEVIKLQLQKQQDELQQQQQQQQQLNDIKPAE